MSTGERWQGEKDARITRNFLTHQTHLGYISRCSFDFMWFFLFPPAKRYGLKPKRHIHAAVLPFLLFVIGCLLILSPTHSTAQGSQSWWGSDRWWDWSDYRGSLGVRFWMPKLASGSITWIGKEHDLLGAGEENKLGGYNFIPNPDYFKEMWFTLYIDRLALRFNFQEDHKFNGMIGTGAFAPYQVSPLAPWDPFNPQKIPDDPQRFSELDVGWTRFGLDLDLVRYPFLRAGINLDRHYEAPIFVNRKEIDSATARMIKSGAIDPSIPDFIYIYAAFYDGNVQKFTTGQPPVTIGLHATAIPGRIRGIPLTAQARIRIPMPLLKHLIQLKSEARVTEWEVSAGLRPAVWHTSLYGFSTFSMGLEAGFRSTYLDMTLDDAKWAVKAHWQGLFVQVGLYY